MAEISSYPLKTPKSGDLIMFSETYDANAANPVIGNPTKSATVGSINALAVNGTVGTIPVFTGSNIIGDSQLVQLGPNTDGVYQIRFNNADRLIVNKPSSVTNGDPEFLIMQDDVAKVSMGWDDDGDGYGFLYNWAGNGWRFGSAGNNPELTIVTTTGQEGVTVANNLIVDGKVGIGTDDPQRELDVNGGVRIRHTLDLFQGNDNSFAGQDAGNLFNIVGSFNTGFGKNSQAAQLNGNSNSSLGFDSLAVSASGNNNTAIGTSSMALSNGGSFNTGVGSNSLSKATAGQGNTAIGFSALGEKTTSNFNTAVGYSSLSNITTGFRNTAVGNDAGKFTSDGTTANSTGRNSIFIGDSAKASADNQTNQIVIGVGAAGNGDNSATIGDSSVTALHVGGNGAGIVLKSPNGTAYKITVDNAGAIIATAI